MPVTSEHALYYGVAGVVLPLLELAAGDGSSSGDVGSLPTGYTFLETAIAMGDEVLEVSLPAVFDSGDAGLYTGPWGENQVACHRGTVDILNVTLTRTPLSHALHSHTHFTLARTHTRAGCAGLGYVLGRLWEATGEQRFLDGAAAVVAWLDDHAQRNSQRPLIAWGDFFDVVAGTVGIGFFLLYASRVLGLESAHAVADETVAAVAALGEADLEGAGAETLAWRMTDGIPPLPNFSHVRAIVDGWRASRGVWLVAGQWNAGGGGDNLPSGT